MTIGRPKMFEGPTTKVSMVVPEGTAHALRVMAAEQGVSIAQLIDAWTQKAQLPAAVERGRQALVEGDVISHQEAGQRLRKWAHK